jgi:integrase
MCLLAKVPVVTTHSLRGLHATLAIKHGSTGHLVASALGHTSYEGVTKRHYVQPGTTEGAASKRVQSMLDGARDEAQAAQESAA